MQPGRIAAAGARVSPKAALPGVRDFYAQNEQNQERVKLSIHAKNITDQVTHRKTIASYDDMEGIPSKKQL